MVPKGPIVNKAVLVQVIGGAGNMFPKGPTVNKSVLLEVIGGK